MDISIAGSFGSTPRRDLGFVRAFAAASEDLGFRALVAPEHVVFFADYDSDYPYSEDGSAAWGPDTGLYDPLFVFAAAAAATTTLRFWTGILILPQRPALLTAKEVLSLDHLTGGRFELGVGVGWSWEEYEALGVPFARRGKRMDEYIQAMRVAWTEDRAAFDGEFVSFTNLVLNPKPVTPGGPRIIVGGESTAAMTRAARLGDGWYGWWARKSDDPPLEQHLETLRTVLADHDRAVTDDDFSLRLGLPLRRETPDDVAALVARAEAAGVQELVLSPPVRTDGFEAQLAVYAAAAGLG